MTGISVSLLVLGFFQRGRRIVRVVNQNGQTRQFVQPIHVADLIRCYPHYYLCNAADTQGRILTLETELEQGNIYLLLPIPRLLPGRASTSPSCCCHSTARGDVFLDHGPAIVFVPSEKRSFFGLFRPVSPTKISSEGRKVAPNACDSDSLATTAELFSKKFEAGDNTQKILYCKSIAARISRWKPRLQVILEDDMLVLPNEVDRVSKPLRMKKTPAKQADHSRTTLKKRPVTDVNVHTFHLSSSLPFQSPISLWLTA